MTRIAILAGSSASGASCINKLVSVPGLTVRGCFRSQERADIIQSRLPPDQTSYESHVGIDASNIDTLKSALEGVDRALLVTPLDYSAGLQNDADNSINMIKAAKYMGVQRIVHVGSWTVNDPFQLPILSARFKPTEDFLESVIGDQMEWTVLRGGYFMPNFSHVHLTRIKEENELLAVPDCNIPPVDVRDIGEAAAALLGGDFDDNYIYHKDHIECCGPDLLSHAEIARELSAGLGRTITYPSSPNLEEWCKTADNPIMLELYKYMAGKSSPGLPFEPNKLAEVLGRQPRSLRQWAEDHRDVFAA